MESVEGMTNEPLNSAITELRLSSERSKILGEGFKSAKVNRDLFQARLLCGVWSSNGIKPPSALEELTRTLDKECNEGKINQKFDTQLEDPTITDKEELVFRKIQRCTDQNERLRTGESRVFAVVVPSYWREEVGLPLMLSSIKEQRFDDTVIVVVSDNNDEEGREKLDISQLAKKDGANVATGSIVANIASARRTGIDRALISDSLSTNPMILIGNDSDSYIKAGYLQAVREAFRDPRVIATTGPLEYRLDSPQMRKVEGKINSHIKERTEGGFAHLPGANAAIRADVYRHIGGYCLDYRIGEDGNLAQKVRDYVKYEGKGRGERVVYVAGQVISTSARKYVDENGNYSEDKHQEYDRPLFKEYFLNVAHGEGLLEQVLSPRDVSSSTILSQLRKWKDKFHDLKYLLSRDGENRVRNMIRILRTWDNFYQRTNNSPEIREAILGDTAEVRSEIDLVIQRELKERGLGASVTETVVLTGTVVRDDKREVSIFIVRKPSDNGIDSRYLAVEVETTSSSDLPIIASLVEIDEGAEQRFTKVAWYPERMFFHPDDDYPRTAALVLNTNYDSISRIPTEHVSILIGVEEIKKGGQLLSTAYRNSIDGDKTLEVLKDFVPLE